MIVNGKHYRTIWPSDDRPEIVQIIDQRNLPHEFVIEDLKTVDDVYRAIREMHVRGAGLIGAAGGYGVMLAAYQSRKQRHMYQAIKSAAAKLKTARPTAVNLSWAVDRQMQQLHENMSPDEMLQVTRETADAIADEDAQACYQIGEHGLTLIKKIAEQKHGTTINILTHCNAGWLAFVDYGSATAPMYAAQDKGISIHVWVDETRPRNQGARLTAWELQQQGIPHTVITDNTGGHLMQHGEVDLVIVGTDRTTYTGDVANKIGTYLKALAAKDNGIPFYVALPSSSFDWTLRDGIKDIPIEERGAEEVRHIQGLLGGRITEVLLTPENSPAANFAFDVTPARLISGLITERGICTADEQAIAALFPEKRSE